MTEPVDRLLAAGQSLTAALDGRDVAAIERANRGLAAATAAVAAQGAWATRPELRDQLRHARALLDAARARVNYLADQTGRRLDRLAALAGAPRSAAYGRRGVRH